MKKYNHLSLLFVLLFLTSNLYSQDALKKGSYSLSGAVTYSSGTYNSDWGETDNENFEFSPAVTYFFIDNISFGIRISYLYSEFNDKIGDQEFLHIIRPYSIGPVMRYYFASNKFIPFIEASYSYSNTITGNNDGNNYSFAGGINYFLSKSVALEPYVEYSKRTFLQGNQKNSSVAVGLRINYLIVN